MALELVGGAALGAAVAELLRAVIDVKDKATNFQAVLIRLESTLKSITPRINAIKDLNDKLNLPDEQMKELVVLLKNGEFLVHKCSKLSTINLVKKIHYSKELLRLDYSLLRYFQTILPLDLFRNDMEMLVIMRELHTKLVGDDKKDEEICHENEVLCTEEELIHLGTGSPRGMSTAEDHILAWLGDVDDEPKGNVIENLPYTSKVPLDSEKECYPNNVRIKPLGHMYHKKSGRNLFLLKGCPYNLDVEDLRQPDCKFVGMGSLGTSYRCDTKYGAVLTKSLLEVNMKERKFKNHIEKLAIVGQHPNVILPIGFHFSEYEKFLLYDYVPAGSLYARLHDYGLNGITPLDWDSRVKIALGTARGISHLHYEGEGGTKFVHGNIKSSNVLLTPDLDGCISDYGLAPIVKYSAAMSQTSGYIAPELNKHMKVTQESDVYSFGVMLLEILTEQRSDSVLFPKWVRYMVMKKGLSVVETELFKLGNCKEGMMEMQRIAMQCLDNEPTRRPKMDCVVRMIEKMQSSHYIKTNEFVFPNLRRLNLY